MSGVAVGLVAVVMLLAGIGVGYVLFKTPATTAPKTTFVVGTNVPFPPFEDFNTTTGDFVGFDIDLAKLFATDLNRTLVIRQFASFTALLGAVGQGAVDMAASAITMSGTSGADRNQSMSFSDSYFAANQGLLVQTTSSITCTNNICTASLLAGKTVGVQQGTTSQDWINANKDPTTTVQVFQTVDAEVAALKAGSLGAVIIDFYPAEALARPSGSGLRVAGSIITGELYGFAVPKNDPDKILPTINATLARIKGNGQYAALIQKWFG